MLKKQLFLFTFIFFMITAIITPVSKAMSPYIPPEKSREELYQDTFISLLMPKISEEVNKYYADILTKPPMLYPYLIFIEDAERVGNYRSFEFMLTVKVYPVVGPHIEVGQDRLKIHVGGTGETEVKDYEHIKDYDLPDNWKHIKQQPKQQENQSTPEQKSQQNPERKSQPKPKPEHTSKD